MDGIIGLTIGIILFNKDIRAYTKFYLENVPAKVASFIPIEISNVKTHTKINRRNINYTNRNYANINYEATGLGELYTYNRMTGRGMLNFSLKDDEGDTAAGKLYTINLIRETRARDYNGKSQTRNENVFSGFCYSLDINNPINCAIRIDTDETLVSLLTESTIEASKKSKALFNFNSAELDKMFDCKVYPKGGNLNKIISHHAGKAVRDISVKATGGIVDNVLSASKIGRTLKAVGVGKVVKNEINSISVSDIANMFTSPEKFEEAMLEARKLITPVVEEFLLYIRKKYGPFTLVINNGINIQISKRQTSMNKINSGQNIFKFTKNYMAGFLQATVLSNNDLKCSTLTKMYEVFMLEWLLNKYFKNLTNVDQFNIEKGAENRLYQDDTIFFEESLELDKRSNNNIDNESDVKQTFTQICS